MREDYYSYITSIYYQTSYERQRHEIAYLKALEARVQKGDSLNTGEKTIYSTYRHLISGIATSAMAGRGSSYIGTTRQAQEGRLWHQEVVRRADSWPGIGGAGLIDHIDLAKTSKDKHVKLDMSCFEEEFKLPQLNTNN